MRCATFRLNRCERWKGWQLFCFCWTILVFCGTICKTVSVFSSHRIGTWKDHTEVLLEFLPKRDRYWNFLFLLLQEYSVFQKTKRLFCLKNWYIFLKKTLTILLKMILRPEFFFHKQMKTCFVWKTNSTFFGKRKNSLVRKKKEQRF